jgi:serine/threonine-protein kinase
LRKDGAMALVEVVTLARELAAALAHAHAAGVVHRDIKPVNVFLNEDPETHARSWKILDFGISKLVDSTGTLTNVGIVGTPGYMSPEQAQGHAVDPRSDVFSMCVVLYRALTGRPAFSGSDTPQIMFEVVYKSPLRPSAAIPGLPFEVDTVFALGLAKNPDDRWASAAEVADALELASEAKSRSEWKSRARKVLKMQPWGQAVRPG